MVFLLFRRRRLSLEMFLAAESDGSRLFRSLMNKIQTIIYKIECSLLVLVDRLNKRCRYFSLAKPRSDQWYGFRSGKCHSFFKIQIKILRLKAFTSVEMSEIPFYRPLSSVSRSKSREHKSKCRLAIALRTDCKNSLCLMRPPAWLRQTLPNFASHSRALYSLLPSVEPNIDFFTHFYPNMVNNKRCCWEECKRDPRIRKSGLSH